MLREVRLHGKLGKRFGKRFALDVSSTAEAIKALCVQLPGFEAYFKKRKYVISIDQSRNVTLDDLRLRLGRAKAIDIFPAPAMAGIETILLIGALVVSVALSVVTLAFAPKAPKAGGRERDTKTDSFVFDGPQNRVEQGHPVALNYGRFLVGSVVISQGISTADVIATDFGLDIGHVGVLPGFSGGMNGPEWIRFGKGGKGGGGTARSAQEDPNTLQSQATARIAELIGEGEQKGLVNGLQSVFFDGTPLENPDGTFNFAGVSVDQRFGLPDQDPLNGFAGTENTIAINTQIKVSTGPVTREITDPEADVARVTIGLPRLFRQDTTNGDLKRHSVTIRISLQSNGGGFSQVLEHTFDGKNTAPYQRSFDVRLSGPAPHQIRVTRVSPDSTLSSVEDDTFFDLLTEIVEAKLSYPDSALIGLTVDARQFGSSIPSRAYEIYGLIVDVPTNYNAETRVYTGVWDGTFKRAWTDNPAWVIYDLVANKRYGLGRRVPEWARDKWNLYSISRYSDELVSDGNGGQRPRFTFNGSITSAVSAYDLIASVAGAFRGWSYWSTGAVMFAQDRPEDPSVLINRTNVIDGVIKYDRITSLTQRRSVVIMYWNDPADNYRLTPEIVEKDDLIRRFGWKPGAALTAFGCTNRAQARMMAELVFEDEGASNAGASYDVGDDHAFAQPGQIVEIADERFAVERRGGRVAAGGANQIQIDRAFDFEAGVNYFASVTLPDGSTQKRPVTNAAGTTAVVNLGGAAFAILPIAGAIWNIDSDVVRNRLFRVRSIGSDGPPYSVRAVRHDPTKYARVETGVATQPDNFLGLPSGGLTGPGAISLFEFLLEDGNASIPSATISWQASPDPRVTFYQAQYRRPGARWESLADSIDLSRDLRPIEPGNWGFRVRALDSLGRKTAWEQTSINLAGGRDVPPAPVDLALISDDDALSAKLGWGAPDDVRPLRYNVIFGSTNNINIADSLGLTDALEFTIKQAGFYWVKSVFMDAQSAPAALQVTAGQLPEPKWTRTQGRPTNLGQLDPTAGGQLAGALVDISALEATYGDTASAAASAAAANDAKIAAQGSAGAASGSATTASAAAVSAAQDSRVSAAFGRTIGKTPNGHFTEGTALWNDSPYVVDGGTEIAQSAYFATYEGRANCFVSPIGFTLAPTGKSFAIDPTRKYQVEAALYSNEPDIVHYIGLTFFDVNGSNLGVAYGSLGGITATAAGWAAYKTDFAGVGGAAGQILSGAVTARPFAFVNYQEALGGNAPKRGAIDYLFASDITELRETEAAALASQGSSATATTQAALALAYAQQSASIGLNSLNREPTFGSYTQSGPAPLGWVNSAGPENYVSVSGETTGRAVRRSAPGGQESHSYCDPLILIEPGQYINLVAHFKLNSGNLKSAGLLMAIENASGGTLGFLSLLFEIDTNNNTGLAAGNGESGRVYRFARMFRVPPEATLAKFGRLYFINHFSSLGDISAANDITWYRVSAHAATTAEIRDQTVLAPLQATVAVQSGALATAQGELQAFWQVEGNAGSDAAFFIAARARSAYGELPTSDVSFGAREVHIFNEVGGVYKKALSAIDGNIILQGGLTANAFIRLGSGEGWPVALRSKDFTVSDGSVIDFNADLGGLPSIDISTTGLAQLAAGESYQLTTPSLTSLAATFSLKIITPGASTAYTLNVDNAPGTGPTRQIDIAGNPQATSGNYQISVSGIAVFNLFSPAEPGFGSLTYRLWVKKSGVWMPALTQIIEMSNGSGNAKKAFSASDTVQLGSGVQAFGFTVEGFADNIVGANTLDLNSVSWTVQATVTSRSATPAGETCKATVRPQ